MSYATELVGYLSQHKITPVMIPASDLTLASSMALFEEHLRRSNLFIVVFGTVARPWVEHRLNEAFKLILINQLLTRIGIYVAPPRKPQTEVKFSRSFDVMINEDTIANPYVGLRPF